MNCKVLNLFPLFGYFGTSKFHNFVFKKNQENDTMKCFAINSKCTKMRLLI